MKTKQGEVEYDVSIIGCGGIGSWILHDLVRPLRRFAEANDVRVTVRVYDSDRVEEENVHHQNFKPDDVGEFKVTAVCEELGEFQNGFILFEPCAWDVRGDDDIGHSHLAVVAVDSPVARKYITESEKVDSWAICTCAGDSFLFLNDKVAADYVSSVTKPDQEPASCQLPGAIANGKIEAGHMGVAVLAQSWVLHSLRALAGDEHSRTPTPRADSITVGTLGNANLSDGVNCQ